MLACRVPLSTGLPVGQTDCAKVRKLAVAIITFCLVEADAKCFVSMLELQVAHGLGERCSLAVTSIQQALLSQEDTQPHAAAGDSDSAEASSSELGSGSDSGQRPLLALPEGWRAIQNVKSTMLHLYKEGATALKCGAWISHNFVNVERPTTVWVRCSKCFG